MKSFREYINEGKYKWEGKTTKDDIEEIEGLIKQFDFYTHMIDSYAQLKKKEARNDIILSKLKELGVTKISVGKDSRVINEGKKDNKHKVTNKEFKTAKFQKWIKTSLGDINDGDKNEESIYLNKAGVEVFAYNFVDEVLTILQPKLTIQQLVMYGLHISTVVPPIK